MVKLKVKQHLKGTLNDLANALKNPKIDKTNANIFLEQARFTLNNFRDYQETLNDELEDMNSTIYLIQRQMMALLNRVADMEWEKDRKKKKTKQKE